MLPRTDPHLHTDKCNQLVAALKQCNLDHRWSLTACNVAYNKVWDCFREEDFSKFSEPSFDAKHWINQAFRLPEAQQNREQYANSCVMKLQLFIGEVNKSLEETSGQIVQTMPRILREVESMQQEAVLLQNRMKAVQQDVQKIETETAAAMDSLLKIDTVKARMHGVEKALREIDNWTSLTADIEEVFASGDANLMASRLGALQQSLKVIGEKVPDYKERRDYLERLKDQFISLISPSVVAAFTSKSVDSVQYFATIFQDLDRISNLEHYYQMCLKAELNKSWNELLMRPSEENVVISLWSEFYDRVLTTWFSQVKWCGQAFQNPAKMICSALTISLGQLDPPMDTVLSDRLDSCEDKLATLVSLKQGLESFLDSMKSSLSSVGVTTGFEALVKELSHAVYKPLLKFVVSYQQYQQSVLLEKLNIWNFEERDLSTNVSRFGESLQTVFSEALLAIDTCNSLTGGLALPMLVKACQTYFNNYLTMVKKLVERGVGSPRRERSFQADDDRRPPQTENWERLQTLLSLMRNFGSFFLELERLEEALCVCYSRMREKTDAGGLTGGGGLMGEEGEDPHLLSVYELLLLKENTVTLGVEQLLYKIGDELLNDGTCLDATPKLLPDVEKQTTRVHQKVIKGVTEQIFSPMDSLFDTLPKLPAWSSATVGEALAGSSIPTFGLSPQEYITKVGQYLMTLAHHMEPFLSVEDPCFCASLKKGTLPHIGKQKKPEKSEEAVQLLIDCAGQGIMLRYADTASRIRELSSSGAQQLATDIDYLSNVVEDLGLIPSESIVSLRDLLRMDPKKLKTAAETHPAALVSAVREMRKVDK